MAEQSAQDVVVQSQSAGDLTPSDAPATTITTDFQVPGEVSSVADEAPKENGVHNPLLFRADELEDASGRSDTGSSRADGSVSEDKASESKQPKKPAAAKPVSFAKYSVPKVIAANAAAKASDKGSSLNDACIPQ